MSYFARHVLVHLDFLLAARARHEAECDAKSRPSVLEELNKAFSVERVSTGKSCAGVGAEFRAVANGAHIININTIEVSCVFAAAAFLRSSARVAAIKSLIDNLFFLVILIDVIF